MRSVLRLAATLTLFLAGVAIGRADAPEAGKDVCPNGGFELLQEAAARPLPQDWGTVGQGPSTRIEMSDDAAEGKRSLHMAAGPSDSIGVNGAVLPVGHGRVHFRYKALKSSVDGANLAFYVIGLNGQAGVEVQRQAFVVPKEHVGDGQWHEAQFEFDFSPRRLRHSLIALRINENTAKGEGDWLVDGVEVMGLLKGPQIKLANVWSDKPLAHDGERIRFSTWAANTGGRDAENVAVTLELSPGASVAQPTQTVAKIVPGSYCRLDWDVTADAPASVSIKVTAKLNGAEEGATQYKILVIGRDATYTRKQLCTDESGYWRLLDKPATLQENNPAPVAEILHKTSDQIKHSTYGICAHLPRAKDYEAPFDPIHLIDGDAETCWSSQQNVSEFPGNPPWAEIDLGAAAEVAQINLVPYWRNTDFPLGFCLKTSVDGTSWQTVVDVKDHTFVADGPKQGDKLVQQFPLTTPVQARYVRIAFDRLPLSGGFYAEVIQGYKARLSGIEVLDKQGQNLALKSRGASVAVCDIFLGWQNTAKAIKESFPRIFDIGLKWIRVGQWGDQTEWAAVEREKGKYEMDPATDRAIQDCADNGVDLLYGLNYGNKLYSNMDKPWGDVGPIYQEGSPFYKNAGPRTEEERQAFVRYVDFVVRKYKGRVKYWELWNEQNGWYPGHEPELYGKLLTAVAKTVKSIDPSAKMSFGGTAAPAPITTEIALREGAAPYLDITAFHPYGIDKPEGGMGTMEFHQDKNLCQSREQTGWNHLEEILEGVRKPFAQHGRPEVEIWQNEFGTNVRGLDYVYNPGIGEYACAKYITRFYIYSGWLNSPVAWWGLYNLNMSQDWGIIDRNNYSMRPMSHALQSVCTMVSDVTPVRSLDYKYEGAAPDPKVISYTKNDSKDTLVLVWAAEGATDQVRCYPSKLSVKLAEQPAQVTLTDIYWGVSQPAVWTYADGTLTLEGLFVHDYPVVITCRRPRITDTRDMTGPLICCDAFRCLLCELVEYFVSGLQMCLQPSAAVQSIVSRAAFDAAEMLLGRSVVSAVDIVVMPSPARATANTEMRERRAFFMMISIPCASAVWLFLADRTTCNRTARLRTQRENRG